MSREPKKKYGIEWLKALGATKFTGTSVPEQAKKWIRTLEKCFRFMQYLEERKVELIVFFITRGSRRLVDIGREYARKSLLGGI